MDRHGVELDSRPGGDEPIVVAAQGHPTSSHGRQGALAEVQDGCGVLVDTEQSDPELVTQPTKPPLPDVAAACVVVAALCVVPMRHHGARQTELGHQVEAVEPEGLGAHLVDLVDGDGGPPQR